MSAKSPRSGSAMSSKQMASAAVAGRRLTFRFLSANEVVQGYLVGMDDYHWFVLEFDNNEVHTTLVHKGSADVIRISQEPTLSQEPPAFQVAVEEIGGSFVSYCERTYLGKTPAAVPTDA